MPRQARIDTSGALHHVICRGIDRQKIFPGRDDYSLFLKRLGDLLLETKTSCFSWALIPSHFHLLLRTGNVPISVLIKRQLTGYVVNFNQRHNRHGHLFQNRYKSILCQEDAYLLELVRYIQDGGKKHSVLLGNGKAWNISKPVGANDETLPIGDYLRGSQGEGDCREKCIHDLMKLN
jgi:REP element-mobilizing transposase RayT